VLLETLTALPQPFTREVATSAGVSRHQIQRELDRGVLTAVHRGLYAVTDDWNATPPWRRHPGLARAAWREHPDTVVSHLSAAALLELRLPPTGLGVAVLTTADRSTTARHPWIDLRHGRLPERHVTTVDDLPVTTPARTLVDCFRSLRLPEAVAVADHAIDSGRCSAADIVAARREERRWPWVTRVDEGLPLVDPRRESWFESTSAVTLCQWGVPLGIPQVDVHTPDGDFVARVDVSWPGTGVVGEADGRGKFLGDEQLGLSDHPEAVARRLLSSHDRAESLRSLRLQVVRWHPEEVRTRPLAVARRWHIAVARSRAEPHGAVLRCRCCRADPTDCEFVRLPGVDIGVSGGRTGNECGWWVR
jgi:hypothetical protein